jgi:X-X-X-Leu-X-X-Gly heptad repeat protein
MNDQQLDNKIRKDAAEVKKDLSTLVADNATQLSRFGDKVSEVTGKAKDDMTTWVDGGISQLSEGIDKLEDGARETVVGTVATVKKDVGFGLSQYNAKAQEVADKVPGGLGEMAARYPWVAISIALAVGLVVGSSLKSARQS